MTRSIPIGSALPADWTCPVCGAAKSQFQQDSPSSEHGSSPAPTGASAVSPIRRAVLAHRVFGYTFLLVYGVLIVQMVPRLWTYQIEFPARTVVHISLGMAIGVVLLLKIAIVRFFRRLDQFLVPSLGTFLLVGSVVLIGISVPSAFREAVATTRLLNEENRERVRTLLVQAGFDSTECTRLTTIDSLRQGQRVLRQDCINCHDLRTVLAKPRTPDSWRQTVRRMAERTTMIKPLEADEQKVVTAYLVALSPDLQRSSRQLRQEQDRRDQSKLAADALSGEQAPSAAYDRIVIRPLFDRKCSQCHKITLVETSPPEGESEARELVTRMVDEGLEATEEELAQLVWYLTQAYGQPSE